MYQAVIDRCMEYGLEIDIQTVITNFEECVVADVFGRGTISTKTLRTFVCFVVKWVTWQSYLLAKPPNLPSTSTRSS